MSDERKNDPYETHRAEIDRIDAQLLELLNRRAAAALEIGRLKRLHNHPILMPEREREVLDRLIRANPGPLPPESVEAVFRAIIDQVRGLQETQGETS